jgi:hypothetical protein
MTQATATLSTSAADRPEGAIHLARVGGVSEQSRRGEEPAGPLSALELPRGVVSLQHWLDLNA